MYVHSVHHLFILVYFYWGGIKPYLAVLVKKKMSFPNIAYCKKYIAVF